MCFIPRRYDQGLRHLRKVSRLLAHGLAVAGQAVGDDFFHAEMNARLVKDAVLPSSISSEWLFLARAVSVCSSRDRI